MKLNPGLSFKSGNKTHLGLNFIELLKQKRLLEHFLLSKNKRDTSQRLYMLYRSLAGNPFLVSIILSVQSPYQAADWMNDTHCARLYYFGPECNIFLSAINFGTGTILP